MSGKAVSITGAPPTPPGPNVLLYVGPHNMSKGTQQEDSRQYIPQCTNERKLKDEGLNNISQMQFSTFNRVNINKEAQMHNNVLSIENGLSIPPPYVCKPVIDPGNSNNNVNCLPTGLSNSFVDVQNVMDGQQMMQSESFPRMMKVNDKSNGNQMMGVCPSNFMEQGQDSRNILSIPQSDERLGSEAGESCSSLSSGDSQGEAPNTNVMIMQGQGPHNNIHTHQHTNTIMVNTMPRRSHTGNMLISNMGGQMEVNATNVPMNFHNVINQANVQQQQQLMNQGISVVCSDEQKDECCSEVRQGVEGEVVIVNNVAHHVMRTPSGGLVLGVLPRPRQCLTDTVHSHVDVPIGWTRLLQGNNICYISPSGAILCSMDQVREYLQSSGTCKCGLDCPLRPEATFSFDPKVMNKPNEMRSGLKVGEMWRGCAGKRRAGHPCSSPAPSLTPPSPLCPEDKKHQSNDVEMSTAKKRKRKGNPYSGVSVSQLLAQRDNMQQQNMQNQQFHQNQLFPNNSNIHLGPEMQQQNVWINSNSMNPNVPHPASPTMRFNNNMQEQCNVNRNVNFPGSNGKNMVFHGPQQMLIKSDSCNSSPPLDNQANSKNNLRSQLLTMNGNAQRNVVDQRQLQQQVMFNVNQPSNIQITPMNQIVNQNGQIIGIQSSNLPRSQSLGSISSNESRNKVSNNSGNIPENSNDSVNKSCDNSRDTERPRNMKVISNGLLTSAELHNLPPEVIEKINQQQHIFIQQNQKQMELAMKSIKNQFVPGNPNMPSMEVKPNQSDMQMNPMVISNNMMMANNQRVPPWQLNRANANTVSVNQQHLTVDNIGNNNQQMMHPQFNNIQQHSGEREPQKNLVNNNANDFNNQRNMNDNNIYSRIPPLHDMPSNVWSEHEVKKKGKTTKGNKKLKSCDNQDFASKPNHNLTVTPMNHSPSCIEDPSGYLAQQAAYMSRQLGMVHMMNPCEDMQSDNLDNRVNSHKTLNTRNNHNPNASKNITNSGSRNSPSQSNLPDSSMNCDKLGEMNKHSHCQGCIAEMNESKNNTLLPYQSKIKNYFIKSENTSQPGTPSPNQCSDDSPVTSSTYNERPGSRSNHFSGPIQGRIISTSNGSPMEGYQIPELSPTPSNSSRNTDTPLSKTSNSAYNISSSCQYPNSSPAYSLQGSSRESVNSNPTTPSPGNLNYSSYNSPEPISNASNQLPPTSISNKSEGMSVRGSSIQINNSNSALFPMPNNRISDCSILQSSSRLLPLECGPNGPFTFFMTSTGIQNLTGIQVSNEVVTTVAGHTLSRNTITSVLAGKAQTATTSINGSATGMPQLYPPVNPNAITHHNNLCPSLPSNYPIHIAGAAVQSLVSKSPQEIVQNVKTSQIQIQSESNSQMNPIQEKQQVRNVNQVTIPGNNQILISGSNQGNVMAPPPPKSQALDTPISTPTSSMAQSISTVAGVPQVINHPTVLVNTIPAPFMIQPQVVTVDGQVVNQNVQVPQIVTGNIIQQGQIIDGNNCSKSPGLNRPALLSPDKKKGKKRKPPSPVSSVMQVSTQHNSNNLLVQHSTQQPQQFVSQGFQVPSNGNMSSPPMLQALTIVPGKGGTPAHIVMNGQTAGNFGSQQILNSQGTQHINLLQPVNLLNGPTGVVQNFPTFQQFIVPGLGGMVMTADGTAILQDPSSMPVQLQIQNVNGQNVLTPVQNQGILAAGPAGMVIRTQNPNNKMIQSQHSPGAQFLSPTGGQIVMGGSPFNGQLSPLIANVSPNQTVAFNNNTPQVRSNVQQEFIQCNQMGQTLMLPVSPNQIAVSSSSNQQNAAFVQQNTTIVQQQTTMVANNQSQYQNIQRNTQNNSTPVLNVEHGLVNQSNNKQNNMLKEKGQSISPQIQPITVQTSGDNPNVKRLVPFPQIGNQNQQMNPDIKSNENSMQMIANFNQHNMISQQEMNAMNPHYRNTVSTQTLVNQQQSGNRSPMQPYSNQSSGASPPDTTTHSPLGSLDNSNGSPVNNLSGRSPTSVHGNQVDTTTASPEPLENNSSAMVQCVSSSEPDTMESSSWGKHREKSSDVREIHQQSPQRQNFYNVDSSGIHFNNQTITVSSLNNQQNLTITPANYYEKSNMTKHNAITVLPANNMEMSVMHDRNKMDSRNINKNTTFFTSEKMSNHNMNQMNMHRNIEDMNTSGYERRLSMQGGDESPMEDKSSPPSNQPDMQSKQFKEGDLVWGPAKGYPAWPGKLITKNTINGKEDGKVLVRWFGGDKCLTVLDSSNLQTLSEGLEAHHTARTKCRKSRKLNSQLEKAIQEAMAELDKMSESKQVNKDMYCDVKSEDVVEDADINGNCSKLLMKSQIGRNTNKTVSEFVSKNESKTKWSSRKECKGGRGAAAAGGIVKIAPHPGAPPSGATQGRLRSSQR